LYTKASFVLISVIDEVFFLLHSCCYRGPQGEGSCGSMIFLDKEFIRM